MSTLGLAALGVMGVMGGTDAKKFFAGGLGRLSIILFLLVVAGEVVNWVQGARNQHRLDEDQRLRDEIARLKGVALRRENAMSALIRSNLFLIASALDYDARDRISLYKRRPDGTFRLVGRYSQHQEYNEFRRASIPAHEGLVFEVWMTQEEKSVDITADPLTNADGYAAEQYATCHVPLETVTALRMKSRNYRAFPVSEGAASPGVVVLESTEVGRFSRDVTVRGKVRSVIQAASDHLSFCIIAADETWQPDEPV